MKAINLKEKFSQISDYWNPRIAAELNGQQVKLAKLKGDFVRHNHPHEDEMFLVMKGVLKLEFDDRIEIIKQGEFIVIPKGVYHKPIADDEVEVLLFEPASTLNTGDQQKSEFTRTNLDFI